MGKTRRYLLEGFARSYLLVFLPFLLIVSLVFLVQISILSSRITLEMTELLQFFGYLLPEIFLYTIPFSLIAALANLFTRLSEENELIALFALGHRPSRLFRMLLPSLLLFCAVLLVISLMLYPQMKQKINAFKQRKLAEATLKISPNKLSQSFGDYHVYVASKDKKGYRDVVLFDNHDPKKHRLFLAKRAVAENNGEHLSLTLYNGIGESSDAHKIQTLRYRRLQIFQYPTLSTRKFLDYRHFWARAADDKRRRGRLLYFLFISLSPLLTFPLIMAMSIFNPRYRKGHAAVTIFLGAVATYVPAALLNRSGSLILFTLFLSGLILGGFVLLRQRVLRYF